MKLMERKESHSYWELTESKLNGLFCFPIAPNRISLCQLFFALGIYILRLYHVEKLVIQMRYKNTFDGFPGVPYEMVLRCRGCKRTCIILMPRC